MTSKSVSTVSGAALLLCVMISMVSAAAAAAARFESLEEWMLWKDDHSKKYVNAKVKTERNLILL